MRREEDDEAQRRSSSSAQAAQRLVRFYRVRCCFTLDGGLGRGVGGDDDDVVGVGLRSPGTSS